MKDNIFEKYKYNFFRFIEGTIKYDTQNMTLFMKTWIDKYLYYIDNDCSFRKLFNRNDVKKIKEICQYIKNIYDFDECGKDIERIKYSRELFNMLKDDFRYEYNLPQKLYRVREIYDASKVGNWKTSLLHIPISKRELCRESRYNTNGQPTLYTSTHPQISWIECGMPQKFAVVELATMNKYVKILDLTFKIETLDRYFNSDDGNLTNNLSTLLRILPVIVICNHTVRKNNNYIEEYILSRELSQFIRLSDDIDGIKYNSSKYSYLNNKTQGSNYAFITKIYDDDGIDKRIQQMYYINRFQIVDAIDRIKYKSEDFLTKINSMYNEILEYNHGSDIEDDLENIFKCIDDIFRELIFEEKFGNLDYILRSLDIILTQYNMIINMFKFYSTKSPKFHFDPNNLGNKNDEFSQHLKYSRLANFKTLDFDFSDILNLM